LQATGKVSLRRRRLPVERLIWSVIGLAHRFDQINQKSGKATRLMAGLFGDFACVLSTGWVAVCCRERWKIEMGFRDIKQPMHANNTVLRSKRPQRCGS